MDRGSSNRNEQTDGDDSMLVWEYCFHHVVESQVLQLQLSCYLKLCGHELSVVLPLRGDLREDNQLHVVLDFVVLNCW